MNILALDMATKTGWATLFDGARFSGVQVFDVKRGESPGMRFLRFRSWLNEISQYINGYQGGIDLIVYEQAHHRGGAATACCVGLVTIALEYAAQVNADVMPVHTRTLKKWATGKGNASKKEMVAAAIAKNYNPDDDNEADALHLLDYAIDELRIQKDG